MTMSLTKGDRLIIKRDGKILTPDAGEAYHEFEVMEDPVSYSFHADGTPLTPDYVYKEGDEIVQGYAVQIKVIR